MVHRPQEVSSDGAAQLDLVTHGDRIVKERRYLTVIEPLDGELDRLAALRRRCDRVAALCFVAIGRSEAHIHVLARNKSQRLAQPEEEALDRRCARLDGDDRRGLPEKLRRSNWCRRHAFTRPVGSRSTNAVSFAGSVTAAAATPPVATTPRLFPPLRSGEESGGGATEHAHCSAPARMS